MPGRKTNRRLRKGRRNTRRFVGGVSPLWQALLGLAAVATASAQPSTTALTVANPKGHEQHEQHEEHEPHAAHGHEHEEHEEKKEPPHFDISGTKLVEIHQNTSFNTPGPYNISLKKNNFAT